MVVDFFTGRGKQDKDISVEKFIFPTSKNVRKRRTMDSFNQKYACPGHLVTHWVIRILKISISTPPHHHNNGYGITF